MAAPSPFEELAQHLSAIGTVKRDLIRVLPQDCPPGAVVVLMLLARYGPLRTSRLAELLAIDMSVTSRHVGHAATRGWIERHPDPLDGRSRLLSLSTGGEQVLAQISERYTQALTDCLSGWSEDDVSRLNELLGRLLASFEDLRAKAPQARTETPTRTPAQR